MTVDRPDRVSFSVEAMVRGYHTCRDIWAAVLGEKGSWQPGRCFHRNRYKRIIAAGLTEEEKDPLGAGRTSTVLNNDSGPSLCHQNNRSTCQNFGSSYFARSAWARKAQTFAPCENFPLLERLLSNGKRTLLAPVIVNRVLLLV